MTTPSMDELKKQLIELLKRDEEFRYAIVGLIGLGEVLAELRKLREDSSKRFEAIERKLLEHDKRFEAIERKLLEYDKRFEAIEKILEEHSKILQEHSKRLEELTRAVLEQGRALEKLSSSIQALGHRYGIFTEEAFREGMKYVIEDLLKEYKVEKWVHYDSEGLVFGYPSWIEVDVLIKDKVHILIEYKVSVDRSDVAEIYRIGQLYEKVKGVKPKLLIVSPALRKRAKELAEKMGVEIRGALAEA